MRFYPQFAFNFKLKIHDVFKIEKIPYVMMFFDIFAARRNRFPI